MPTNYFHKKGGYLQNETSSFLMSGKRDSNPRPSAWEAEALPTELLPHYPLRGYKYTCYLFEMQIRK